MNLVLLQVVLIRSIVMKKKSKDQQMMVQYEEAMKQIKKMSVICSFIIVLVISISTLIPNPSYALLEEKTLPETFSLEESDAYLEEIDDLGRELGIDMIREKERYRQMFEADPVASFTTLLEEVEDSLSFIKSNRVNTYEMLFEADEMMRRAEEAETENDRLVVQTELENPSFNDEIDTEVEALLDDPEEMIKLLKKRKGI